MKLKEWADFHHVDVQHQGHARTIHVEPSKRYGLFSLDDYMIVGADWNDIYWLVRRHEFTEEEQQIRMRVRGYCEKCSSINEINSLWDGEFISEFGQDCIAEFILEFEAKSQANSGVKQ